MLSVLVDSVGTMKCKTVPMNRGDWETVVSFREEVRGPSNDNSESNNLISELTKGKTCTLKLDLKRRDDEYCLTLSSSSACTNVMKNLQKRFPDAVLLSVEISSSKTDAIDDSSEGTSECCSNGSGFDSEQEGKSSDNPGRDLNFTCVSAVMTIGANHRTYLAETFEMDILDVKELLHASNFHVKITARIDSDLVNPLSNLAKKNIEKILNEGVGSDVTIVAGEGAEIKSYKVFLMASSKKFRNMFENDMSESQHGRIEIPDMTEEGVKAFLRFIYYGETIGPNSEIDLAYELLCASHKYEMSELEVFMTTHLIGRNDEDFSADLAFKIYSFVKKEQLKSASALKNKLIRVLKLNVDDLNELPQFEEVFHKNAADAKDMFVDFVKINSTVKRKMNSGGRKTFVKVGRREN